MKLANCLKRISQAALLSTVLISTADAGARRFSIMTYNFENLFDTKKDAGKKDWTWQPMTYKESSKAHTAACMQMPYHYRQDCFDLDWNKKVMDTKIRKLARVVRTVGKKGPDVLILQEVENIRALEEFNRISGFDYREVILLEGPDSRGIDVAILSHYPLASKAKQHRVKLPAPTNELVGKSATRDILEATFNIKGDKVTFFANHWPSQANDDSHRVAAAKVLMKRIRSLRGSAAIAMGDFNTEENDKVNAIKSVLLNTNKTVHMIDALEKAPSSVADGTHYYRGKWAHLDKIFFMNTALQNIKGNCRRTTCLRPVWSSYKVIKNKFMLTDLEDSKGVHKNVPKRYDPVGLDGYSDHLPVYMEVEL